LVTDASLADSLNEARRLLELSGKVEWSFPSSSGRPASSDARWLERLLAERTSFPIAARQLIEVGEHEAALEIAANTWRLWIAARDISGGRAFLADVFERTEGSHSRARALALYGDGLFAFWAGDHNGSLERNEEALAIAKSLDDPEGLALANLGLARVALEQGEHERARSLASSARGLAAPLGAAMGQAPLHIHAQATRMAGDYDEAAALFQQSLALNRRLGDTGMVMVELHNLGHVELHRNQVDAAERAFGECSELSGEEEDTYGAAMSCLNEGAVAFAKGDRDSAGVLLARAESLLSGGGEQVAFDDQFEIDWLRHALSEA
jgi:tetratricopeptide (TPR) repeat protein